MVSDAQWSLIVSIGTVMVTSAFPMARFYIDHLTIRPPFLLIFFLCKPLCELSCTHDSNQAAQAAHWYSHQHMNLTHKC